MKISGKFLCWVLLLLMLCVVSYGGCGGSSSDSDLNNSDSREETPANPENPNPQPQPTPTPENPEESGGTYSIEGQWKIASSKTIIDRYTKDETTTFSYSGDNEDDEPFSIVLQDNGNDSYTIKLQGSRVYTNNYGGVGINVLGEQGQSRWDAVSEGDNFKKTAENTYTMIYEESNVKNTIVFRLIDSSTLSYSEDIISDNDDATYNYNLETTLKRAN